MSGRCDECQCPSSVYCSVCWSGDDLEKGKLLQQRDEAEQQLAAMTAERDAATRDRDRLFEMSHTLAERVGVLSEAWEMLADDKTWESSGGRNAILVRVRDIARAALAAAQPDGDHPSPVPMVLHCPECNEPHADEGEWATRLHKTHQCQSCGHEWRPFDYATVGVEPDGADAAREGGA